VPFNYHDSSLRRERETLRTDHCASDGRTYDLAELLVDGRIESPVEWDAEQVLAAFVRPPATVIYAISEDRRIRVATDGTRGEWNAVKHETLFHNATVLAAGELRIVGGVVAHVDDGSGSYGTRGAMIQDPSFAAVILESFEALGVSFTEEERQRLRALAER
jgi:hypothetical protein